MIPQVLDERQLLLMNQFVTWQDESVIVPSDDKDDQDAQQKQQHHPAFSSTRGDLPAPPPADDSSSSWYARNITAMRDPRDVRKHIVAESRLGLTIVEALQVASSASKQKNKKATNDITGKRRERKSVLPSDTWDDIEQRLREAGIELVSREKGPDAPTTCRTRATLTYYGTTAAFYNHQLSTKIRMRIRYYLSYVRTEDGIITDVQREGATKEKGFLELKVKGPRANEENSVDKYRLLVSDAIMARLVNLDATRPTFLNDLELVKQAVQKESKDENTVPLINVMFKTIGKLSRRKPAFIRPSLVISYERSAFKYIEHDYPIPVAGSTTASQKQNEQQQQSSKGGESSTRKSNKHRHPRIRVIQHARRHNHGVRKPLQHVTNGTSDEIDGIFRDHHDGDDSTVDTSPSKNNLELHDIEYQFTVDRTVRAHYPLLPIRGATKMPVAEHFDVDNRTELMHYPPEARVVEFKEPLAVATLPEKDRSVDHNSLIRILVSRMEAEIMWGDYDENVGKFGNFRRRLIEEHHTDRIKNELIRIDFSGTGQYQQEPDRTTEALRGFEHSSGELSTSEILATFIADAYLTPGEVAHDHAGEEYDSSTAATDYDSDSSWEC